MILENWLKKRSYTDPDRLALVYEGHEWTFAELYQSSAQLAKTLAEPLGLEAPHDLPKDLRVGMLCDNSPASYLTILAFMHLGVQIVMLNTRLSVEELSYQVQDAQLNHIFFTCDAEAKAHALPSQSHEIETLYRAATEAPTAEDVNLWVRPEFDLDQVMSILYTSGTTGNPKGVMQSYGNHFWSSTSGALTSGITQSDAWVCTVPLFHISGLSILVRGLVYGIPVYLFRKFNASAVNDVLLAGKASIVSVVAYALTKLVADLEERRSSGTAQSYPASFRYMLLGGGFFEDSLLEHCERLGIPVIRSFGMSETCSQVIATPLRPDHYKPGSSGVPLFPNQLRIASTDPDGEAQTLPAGQVGEIQIKAPALCVGYLGKPEKYAAAFTTDDWYRTGDIGLMDGDGFLFVKARLTDLIISGGENVYPSEVEHVFARHHAIAEVAVVGHEDEEWGQVPWAYLVLREGEECPSDDALISFAREHLAGYKLPKRFIWIDALPKTSIGKIQKFKLL